MYTSFYGLTELPFDLSPNPRYLLMTPRHREALANLQYGISSRKSLTLLLGEAGTGKTTLIRAALASDACRGARVLHLNNPSLTRDEFIEFLGRGFDLGAAAMSSKATMLHRLESELLSRRAAGETIALVVDEAQALPYELLEEIRMLANIETATEKLLPVVLAGQPELADRLNEPSMRQLKQRVALRCTLGLLDAVECAAYVAGRLKVAGGDGAQIFTREALRAIFQHSGGVPRTVNVICDNALVNGFAEGVRPVTDTLVEAVCREFDLSNPSAPSPRPLPQTPGVQGMAPANNESDRLFSSINRKRRFSSLDQSEPTKMSRIEDAMKRAGGTAAADVYANLDTVSVEVMPELAITSPSDDDRTGLFDAYLGSGEQKLIVNTQAPPIAREQYRRLAATLHHVQAERNIRSVMIASALAEEGKTLTAVNLALTLSESYQRRVLLIDADLRRPNVHNAFGIANVHGLSDVLRARDEQRLPLTQVSSRLAVLSAGKPNPDPMDILTSSRMVRILEEAGANFDWVIVDTPPVGILTDANLLAAMVDSALFVIAAGRTPFAVIRKAIDALGRDRILGVVLNRADSKSIAQNDYYYRYYGSRERKGFRFRFPGQ